MIMNEYTKIRIKKYIIKYVLPLIGYTIDECKTSIIMISTEKNEVKKSESIYYFNYKKELYIKCEIESIKDAAKDSNIKMFNDFLFDYIELEINASKMFLSKGSIDYMSGDSEFNKLLYENSIERGVCRWINSNTESMNQIEKLLKVLEKWTLKTYEGHHVCYGFVIDLNLKNNKDFSSYYNDFMHFLDDEYSAVLSDGFSSLIKLDMNCNFVDYLSLTKDEIIPECNMMELLLPYRFSQLIDRYVNNDNNQNNIGIFLLQNGDIIVSKNREIKFIKRNNKWLNFSSISFVKSIQNNTENFKNEYLKQIYATTLDVSLSHSGGIVAVVDKNFLLEKGLLNRIDDLTQNESFEELFFKEFSDKYFNLIEKYNDSIKTELNNILEIKNKTELDRVIDGYHITELEVLKLDIIKRLTKRNVLIKLLNNKNFFSIDRKLRAELIGMDGACILDKDFNVISFGAIIRNEAGSSGGGRGAAAKSLSLFGGFSIKISTDGYIEVYVNGKKIYSIK